MRFVCDHDVGVAVAATLRRLRHEAWTVVVAGPSAAADEDLTAYAHDMGLRCCWRPSGADRTAMIGSG